MARKAKQHVIPKVYLRPFCDPRPPAGHGANQRFEPALWILDTTLSLPPRRAAPKNVAWVRHAYTLKNDDPEHALIEESLSRLEALYSAVMSRIRSGAGLGQDDRELISLFVGALRARTEGMMAHAQEFFDKVTGFLRAYMGDKADKTIEPWGELADAGKRQIGPSSEAFAKVTGPRMLLLENQSAMPFITSDSPVTHLILHADELIGLGIPEEFLFQGIPRSERGFFSFCPLTPRLAYLSSAFFPIRPEIERAVTESIPQVFALNELTRTNGSRELYSPSPAPYGPLIGAAREHDRRREADREARRNGLSIYTKLERYWLTTTFVDHPTPMHPLNVRLAFKTPDLRTLQAIATEGLLVDVTQYADGNGVSGMREARFVQVAITGDGVSIIENGPSL